MDVPRAGADHRRRRVPQRNSGRRRLRRRPPGEHLDPVRRPDRPRARPVVPDQPDLGDRRDADVRPLRRRHRRHVRLHLRRVHDRLDRRRLRGRGRAVRRHGRVGLRHRPRPVELGQHPVRRADRDHRREHRVRVRRRQHVQPDHRLGGRDRLLGPDRLRHAEAQAVVARRVRGRGAAAQGRDLRRADAVPRLHQPVPQPAADLRAGRTRSQPARARSAAADNRSARCGGSAAARPHRPSTAPSTNDGGRGAGAAGRRG